MARPVLLLAAVAGAIATVASAVGGWHAATDVASARSAFVLLRSGAAHEAAYLDRLRRNPRSTGNRSSFFAAAQAETALLVRVARDVPASQRSRVREVERTHLAAVEAAARGLSPRHGAAAQLRTALRRLEQVELRAAALQTDRSLTDVRPWPSTTLERAGAADLALVLLAGLSGLLRHAVRAAGLRRGEGDGSASSAEIERLTQVARSDSLTGLANHRAFQDDLSTVIERRNADGTPFSLLALDLDGLKQINDVQGHQSGDAYIRTVAGCIEEEVGAKGRVYRTGGDEFMAILPGCRGWHALTVAHAIQRTSNQRTGRRALSIGIAESTKTEGRRALLHQADLALYEAKRAKLLAVSYHEGLEPRQVDAGAVGPSEHQKALAAALAQAVDAHDAGTRNHSETVAELCAALGARLGISGEGLERLRIAGLLHDVGKIGVSDTVLTKRGALGPDERSEIELHTTVGHSILTSAGLHKEAVWVLHHHERFDGAGYPTGLAGEAIPIESRIIAVADAFEAMTGSRPYRDALTPEQALTELALHSGTQFDHRCVQVLNELFGGAELPAATARDGAGVAAIA
ncbi:MAG TPA: diguanylate cyclase [Gaiellaceae bacterium]|nr:diguanylate cyclase [Gaiellaceae bacterium]